MFDPIRAKAIVVRPSGKCVTFDDHSYEYSVSEIPRLLPQDVDGEHHTSQAECDTELPCHIVPVVVVDARRWDAMQKFEGIARAGFSDASDLIKQVSPTWKVIQEIDALREEHSK